MGVIYQHLSEKSRGEYILDKIKNKARQRTALTDLPDIADWIQGNFRLYDTGNLIELYDCQIRPLRRAMTLDENGDFRFSTILWSWPKKSAKSSVIAAVVDYVAWNRPYSQIRLFSNDLKQSDSRIGFYLRENLKLGNRKDFVNIKTSGYSIEYQNGSRVEMVPIDPSGEAGGNDDMIVYSELWGWKSKAHQMMWSEATLSPNKFGKSQRWIDSYAGYLNSSPILALVHKAGVTQARRVWDDLEVYENEAARMLSTWVTRPMLPWQVSEKGAAYYAEQATTLSPHEFDRMHRNQWVSSVDQFVPLEWWQSCRTEIQPLENNQSVILIADAAVSNDTFGLLAISGNDNNGVYDVRYARRWLPPRGGKINFDEPEQEIRRLVNQWNCVLFVYDEFQLADMAGRFQREMLIHTYSFPQGKDRLIADKKLQDAIRDRRIRHSGEPDLTEHIKNASAKQEGENKLRLVKQSEESKIDLAVCLSMGLEMAAYWQL